MPRNRSVPSGAIGFDRFNFSVVAVDVQCDRTAANFAILNRGKRPGRSVDDRGEDRSAIWANHSGLYFEVHCENVTTKRMGDRDFFRMTARRNRNRNVCCVDSWGVHLGGSRNWTSRKGTRRRRPNPFAFAYLCVPCAMPRSGRNSRENARFSTIALQRTQRMEIHGPPSRCQNLFETLRSSVLSISMFTLR